MKILNKVSEWIESRIRPRLSEVADYDLLNEVRKRGYLVSLPAGRHDIVKTRKRSGSKGV